MPDRREIGETKYSKRAIYLRRLTVAVSCGTVLEMQYDL